ncbi:MAG: archaemetzincin family Zn-dependent metalloprotease [Anaeromyxobacteraceae bacterium]
MEAIHLWWIGEKDPGARTLEHVRLHLGKALGANVRIWDGPDRPPDAYDHRRKQWSTARILSWLATAGPPGKVLAVTDQDLFIPILTFVFGEAQLNGRAAVVSTARLGEPGLPDPRVAVERLAKESVHELGHCFGLVHCDSPGCVMGRSASARDVDRKRGEFCSKCRDRVTRSGGEAR